MIFFRQFGNTFLQVGYKKEVDEEGGIIYSFQVSFSTLYHWLGKDWVMHHKLIATIIAFLLFIRLNSTNTFYYNILLPT